MFGKKVKDYVRFERWILILIVVVFALRLGLSLAGVSKAEYPVMTRTGIPTIPKATEWVSINLVLLVGILYCAIAVQTRGFGTYVQTWRGHVLPCHGSVLTRSVLRGV